MLRPPAFVQESLDLRLPDEVAQAAVTIRRSARARRLGVRVFHDGRVEVVAPVRASQGAIERFMALHAGWVERQRRAVRERGIARAADPFPPPAIALPAFGETWRLHLAGGDGPPRARTRSAGLLHLAGAASPARTAGAALQRWLAGHARPRLVAQLDALAREHGLAYRDLQLRRQRSRWGSCSTRGTISLNVCLSFQRPEVVRYLMIHELTHLEHMNHSARFWRAVERRCAAWRQLDRELLDGWRNVPRWVFA
jgi:hypothetical protein